MSGIIRDIKKSVPPKGRILDWGTGDGSLLALIDRAGYESYGIDAYSLNSNQKNLYKCDILDAPFKDEFFDAITCFHVLEHIEKPVPALEKAMRLLKPKGTLVVEVPNIDSFAFQIFRENWYPLDIPVHLNHFSLEVLQRLIDIANKNRIIKVDYFSHKQSPSAVLLSIFPYISPPRVRARYSGRFPLPLMLLYLFLQMVVYPFPIVEALVQRGEVIRIYVQKM